VGGGWEEEGEELGLLSAEETPGRGLAGDAQAASQRARPRGRAKLRPPRQSPARPILGAGQSTGQSKTRGAHRGVTVMTRWPLLASSMGSPPTTSPRPPARRGCAAGWGRGAHRCWGGGEGTVCVWPQPSGLGASAAVGAGSDEPPRDAARARPEARPRTPPPHAPVLDQGATSAATKTRSRGLAGDEGRDARRGAVWLRVGAGARSGSPRSPALAARARFVARCVIAARPRPGRGGGSGARARPRSPARSLRLALRYRCAPATRARRRQRRQRHCKGRRQPRCARRPRRVLGASVRPPHALCPTCLLRGGGAE
jgi:hypothetical protein